VQSIGGGQSKIVGRLLGDLLLVTRRARNAEKKKKMHKGSNDRKAAERKIVHQFSEPSSGGKGSGGGRIQEDG